MNARPMASRGWRIGLEAIACAIAFALGACWRDATAPTTFGIDLARFDQLAYEIQAASPADLRAAELALLETRGPHSYEYGHWKGRLDEMAYVAAELECLRTDALNNPTKMRRFRAERKK